MVVGLLFQCKMKLLFVALFIFIANSFAVDVKSIVPSFLMPQESLANGSSANQAVIKNNNSSSKRLYCNGKNSDSVFCTNNEPKAYIVKLESSSKQQSNSTNSSAIDATQNTNSNQKTMQDQDVRNAMGKYQGGMSLPIAPTDDIKMNINQQQLEFNIKY